MKEESISEGGIKRDGNSGTPEKSIREFGKANENCCNTLAQVSNFSNKFSNCNGYAVHQQNNAMSTTMYRNR